MGMIMKQKQPKEDHVFPMRFIINEAPKEQSFREINQLNNICKKLIEEQRELKKQIHDQKNQIDQLKNEKEVIENFKPPVSNDNFIQTHRIQLKDPHILSAEIELQPKNEEVSSGFKLDEALFTFMDSDGKNMAETSRFGAVPEPPKSSRFPREVFVRRVKRSRG
ncbi:unnamed protein product [Blepharisma stoltei]|uniref:Uncharacterized protein n=1 Tax=Blepharisma stoltei TaxID=1481888 RepID=A0AAU9I8B8_9CILI|nr:unnamed protein product [Blepharisma stoltei]